jgi:integrase/recombinase XerD
LPNKEGSSKTFFRISEKVKTQAMSQAQWIAFFKELEKSNPRDCLIEKVILQVGKGSK